MTTIGIKGITNHTESGGGEVMIVSEDKVRKRHIFTIFNLRNSWPFWLNVQAKYVLGVISTKRI